MGTIFGFIFALVLMGFLTWVLFSVCATARLLGPYEPSDNVEKKAEFTFVKNEEEDEVDETLGIPIDILEHREVN